MQVARKYFLHLISRFINLYSTYALTDNFKVFNLMLHSVVLFSYNFSFLLNKLTKFHSIFSDDYEKKYHSERDINLTDVHYSRPSNKIFVAYSMYPAFLFRPSIY